MSDEQTREDAQVRISHGISSFFLSLIGILSLLAAGALVGFNANNNSNITGTQMPYGGHMVAGSVAPASTLTVAMRDPGCHWIKVGNAYKKTTSVTGPVNLLNADEDAIRVVGANGTQTTAVGKTVSLAPGTYKIAMV